MGKICEHCNNELTIENFSKVSIDENIFICRVCKKHLCDKKYREKNKDELSAKSKEKYSNNRNLVIENLGGLCACCGESVYEFLTIDHIFNDGNEERKTFAPKLFLRHIIKNNFPKEKYQILCWNCNFSKKMFGACAHSVEPCYYNICSRNFLESGRCKNCGVIFNSFNRADYTYCKICHYELSRKISYNIKVDVFNNYGGNCICCKENNINFLSIDHINSDGANHRRELKTKGGVDFYRWLRKENYPKDNFQLLCYNCNSAKFYHKQCPHNNLAYSKDIDDTASQ